MIIRTVCALIAVAASGESKSLAFLLSSVSLHSEIKQFKRPSGRIITFSGFNVAVDYSSTVSGVQSACNLNDQALI